MKTNNQGDKVIQRKEMRRRPSNESPSQNCPASTDGMAKTSTKDDTNLKSRARLKKDTFEQNAFLTKSL